MTPSRSPSDEPQRQGAGSERVLAEPLHIASRHVSEETLSIHVRPGAPRTYVTPVGQLDLRSTAVFDQYLSRAQAESAEVVVDLRALTFIDSAGVRSLFAAWLRATEAYRRVAVICSAGQPRRMLSLSRLDRVMEVVEPPASLRSVEIQRAA